MRLSELAAMLNSSTTATGEDFEIHGISTLEEAKEGEISFVTDQKFLKKVATTRATAVLVPDNIEFDLKKPYIPIPDPWAGVLTVLKHFYPHFDRRAYQGVHPSAVVDPSARLAENVTIGPLAVIGAQVEIGKGSYLGPGVVIGNNCVIGEGCTIYANAVLESETRLGNGVYIQPGAVLGADGFKYELIRGRWTKIPQVGHVEIAADAEIGANTCVDRASYTVTAVGANTKIDNLVQIAHNVQVGENSIIVSQTGVAGSTTIGNNTILAAQAGVADNIKIGNQVVILARSGVTQDIDDGETRMGFPARASGRTSRIMAIENKLPEMYAELKRLTKKVAELEARLQQADGETDN